MSKKRIHRKPIVSWIIYLIIIILLMLFAFPVFWMFLMSLKPRLQLFSTIFVFDPTITNYIDLFKMMNVFKYIKNSFIVVVSTLVLSIPIGSVAAYTFARFRFKFKKILLFSILFFRMLPPISSIIPLFLFIRELGWTDTYYALIWLYSSFQIPFIIWMMRSFFMAIPTDLEEAAMVDGASRLGAVLRVTLPLSAAGMAATAMLTFIACWQDFLFALIFTGRNAKTFPVAIPEWIGEMGTYWGELTACGVIALIPTLILTLILQKHMVRAMTFGVIKR